jgi:hypothetical protein
MGANGSIPREQWETLQAQKRQQDADQMQKDLFEIKKGLLDVSTSYYDAESKCNLPPLVFWLSAKAREDCKQARMATFTKVVDLGFKMAES